jgi:hypothetical protein
MLVKKGKRRDFGDCNGSKYQLIPTYICHCV